MFAGPLRSLRNAFIRSNDERGTTAVPRMVVWRKMSGWFGISSRSRWNEKRGRSLMPIS